MATVSSHLLNGTDGTHAADVKIQLNKVESGGNRTLVFDSQTDTGGRLLETLDEKTLETDSSYELQIDSGSYWRSQKTDNSHKNICEVILFRFRMPDASARYHLPFIISPNSYSVWWSAAE